MPKKENLTQDCEKQNQGSECFTVEKLKELCKTPDAVYEGICASKGWHKGRVVSMEEYKEASRYFLGAVVGGKINE